MSEFAVFHRGSSVLLGFGVSALIVFMSRLVMMMSGCSMMP
ncbi:hypothetical protein [Mesorhizobium sp. AR07]|nr:hypothetical protein [Mesorhizobium sp. AR07]